MNFICDNCGKIFSVKGEDAIILMINSKFICPECEQEQEEKP